MPLQATNESELGIWYSSSSSSYHTISRRARLLEQGYASGQDEQWGVLGESHQSMREMVLQLHRGMVCCHQSWELLVLSNASALPSEIQLNPYHHIPWNTLWGNFGYSQPLLLPAYINRKGHWSGIIPDRELGGREKSRKKKKKVQFVGNVSRMKSSQLVPSGALHPPAFKQACSAAAMSFSRSGVLGRAAV